VASLIFAASMLATYFLARPIRQFAEELRQRGGDLRAGPVREAGPKELRAEQRIQRAAGATPKVRR